MYANFRATWVNLNGNFSKASGYGIFRKYFAACEYNIESKNIYNSPAGSKLTQRFNIRMLN